jgi:hypothetical protein
MTLQRTTPTTTTHRRKRTDSDTPAAPSPVTATTSWSTSELGVPERMLALTYRLARTAGYSPHASNRLCRAVFQNGRTWLDPHLAGEAGTDRAAACEASRRIRARVLAIARARIEPHVDTGRLHHAVETAVAGDEMELLPPRQRAVLRWVVQRHQTVEQVTERTGWTPTQVNRLLRAGLRTIHGHSTG